jgi:hypothetical protein
MFLRYLFLSLIISFNAFAIKPSDTELKEFDVIRRKSVVNIKCNTASGLGNRLKKLASYIRYFNPKHVNMYWPNTGWVSSSFYDLFELKLSIKINEINSSYLIDNFYDKNVLYPYVDEYNLMVVKSDFSNTTPFIINNKFNDIPKEILKIYVPIFEKIKPSKAVQERIDTVKLPQNTVAIQIRNAKDWDDMQRNEDISLFFYHMDKYPSDTVFYLSAMSKDIANYFYNRYSDRIIELPNKNYSSMIDAVADMYILGSTNEAIYSYGSTFAEVGWWLNGAKSHVTTVGTSNNWKLKPANFPILDKIY